MPAKKKVSASSRTKTRPASRVKARRTVRPVSARRAAENDLFVQHPNLKLLLSILGLIIVAYFLAFLLMPIQ